MVFIHQYISLAAQWNCGRGPCRVSVVSEVQFVAYALVKMTPPPLFFSLQHDTFYSAAFPNI